MASYLGRPARTRRARIARLRRGVEGDAQKTRQAAPQKRFSLRRLVAKPSGPQKSCAGPAKNKAPFSLHNPITMQQRQEIEQAARAPRSGGRRLVAAVVLVAAAVLAEPLASVVHRVYRAITHDQYELYRSKAAQSSLQAANARMLSELIALRSKRTKQSAELEGALAQKIAELESLIEGVTALGLFRDRAYRSKSARAESRPQTAERQSELAAILNSPRLNGISPKDDSSEQDDGVGGAEELCDGHLADEGPHREAMAADNVSITEGCEVGRAEPHNTEDNVLVSRINRFISVLEFLPLGTPVQGSLTSGFGHRRSPFSHGTSFHYGVDISLRVGTQVRVTGAGTVVKVDRDGTYGLVVDVQHAPKLITRYAHLSKALVSEGQKVRRGMAIALSGNTGRSTGPHLHYEVRHNGHPRNPAPFVKLAGRLAEFVNLNGRII